MTDLHPSLTLFRRIVLIVAATALLILGAREIAAQETQMPKVTVAAERDSIGFGIDDAVFALTRSGGKDGALTVAVTLNQADPYLPGDRLERTVELSAGQTEAELRIPAREFTGGATATGTLTATVSASPDYLVGRPNSARTRLVVADPAVTVRPDRPSYSVEEGDGSVRITFLARTAADFPKPGNTVSIAVSTRARSDPRIVDFAPADFAADGGAWQASKTVAVALPEDGQGLDVTFRRAASTPERVRPRNSDGAPCAGDVCTVPVTIRDGPVLQAPRLTIAPVPPQASADHGPHYSKDEFLALPGGAVHGPGARLTFALAFDEAVTVAGAPELVLDIWNRERRALYTGGSGTERLTFVWDVAKGDNDPDGLEFRALDLKGGAIRIAGDDFDAVGLAALHFAEHRVRGGLFAMRLEVDGPAREGEKLEVRVIRDGGYDELAVAGVDIGDSALPHVAPGDPHAENGPGHRQFTFKDGAADGPRVRVSRRIVVPPGDGIADDGRRLTVRLVDTDAGFILTDGHRYRTWYLTEGKLEATVKVIDTGIPLAMAGLRVHGASAREAPGATLAFRVTLSPRSEAPVTVGYRTGDDPANRREAIAGSDYVAANGRLTFQPGETVKTVEVEILPDDHDEGAETMRLFLENAEGARIDVADALGVIRNDGPIPKAWIARFGRTVADQVLGAVEGRIRAARGPGAALTIAGRRVGGDGQGGGAGSGDPAASSFALTARAGEDGHLALWGRGAATGFDGEAGELALDGAVTGAMLGADWSRGAAAEPGAWTAGLIVARSHGEGGYEGAGEGRIEATLTGLYPWGRLALSETVDAWAAAGYGAGKLAVTPGDGPTMRADLDLRMAAAGLRGTLLDPGTESGAGGGTDGLAVTGKADALVVATGSARGRSADGGNLAAASATVTRLRLGLEGSRPFGVGGDAALTPSVEIGLRHDGGDAETGLGLDVGGGVALAVPGRGIRAALRGRGLLAHEAGGFRERGFSGELAWDPGLSTARGPALTLAHTVGGAAAGGADALLAPDAPAGLGAGGGGRFEARFAYGVAIPGGRFASVPEIGLALTGGAREYILGWRLADEGAGALGLSAEAARRETAADAEHRIAARVSARW